MCHLVPRRGLRAPIPWPRFGVLHGSCAGALRRPGRILRGRSLHLSRRGVTAPSVLWEQVGGAVGGTLLGQEIGSGCTCVCRIAGQPACSRGAEQGGAVFPGCPLKGTEVESFGDAGGAHDVVTLASPLS